MTQEWKLLTESQHQRLSDALHELESLTEQLSDEHLLPDAVEQVLLFTGWAMKEIDDMPVVSEGFYR